MASYFEELNAVNVNEHTEKKKTGGTELTYLSWPYAIAEVSKRYPDFSYEVVKFDGKPFVYDPLTGYMVYTTVTLNGITREMWLPVMDGANKAMKAEPYSYSTSYGKKTVAAATMFDINKTIMRCLVKNLAMFGLGLYIYAGEDLPEGDKEPEPAKEPEKKSIPATKEEIKAMYDAIVFVYGKENARAYFQELTGRTETAGMTKAEVDNVTRILKVKAGAPSDN